VKISKKGQDLLAELSTQDLYEFLLKFAFMTEEQMAEREALPTIEARRDFMRNLPLPERKK